jgi:hypothetical protein
MSRVGDVSVAVIERALASHGLALDFGGARVCVRSRCRGLAAKLQVVYAEFPFQQEAKGFFDVTAELEPARGWRASGRRDISFIVDGERPFEDLPADLDLPMLEWGLNWCISQRGNHRLVLHAGVVEREGFAIVMPALPGSGKSTLTAALATRGWRLLSDEFGPIDATDGTMIPMLRPVALKNESIDVIRRFAPDAVLGPDFPGTHKGTVAHLAPDARSVSMRHTPAQPVAVVFPRFEQGVEPRTEALPGAFSFTKLAGNSFNYSLLGPLGFASLKRLVQSVPCYRIAYGSLAQAVEIVESLHRQLTLASKASAYVARPQAARPAAAI